MEVLSCTSRERSVKKYGNYCANSDVNYDPELIQTRKIARDVDWITTKDTKEGGGRGEEQEGKSANLDSSCSFCRTLFYFRINPARE